MNNEDDPFVQSYKREHPRREVAILLLINPRSEVLLVRTKRLPNHWQPLGGGIDRGDASPSEAVLREIREESGLEVLPTAIIHLCDLPYDFGVGTVHSFAARLETVSELSFDATEIEEARWFSLSEAVNLPMFPATAETLRIAECRADLFQ